MAPAGDRDHALAWAADARRVREQTRAELSDGSVAVADVLESGSDDPMVGAVRLLWVLESLPGARKSDTRRALAALGLDGDRAISDLSPQERATVLDRFAAPGAAT